MSPQLPRRHVLGAAALGGLVGAFGTGHQALASTPARTSELDLSTASALPPLRPPVDPTTPARPGHFLLASDEFNGADLNPRLFLKDYLPHWSTGQTVPDLDLAEGCLRLNLRKERGGWDPVFDEATKVSSIQTYERDDLHRWANYPAPVRSVPHFRGHLQKYGHFELRARVARGGAVHSAWWMIGANQDQAEHSNVDGRESGEVDIFEVLGKDNATGGQFSVHPWRDKLGLFPIKRTFGLPGGASFADDFHLFEFDWSAQGMSLSIDRRQITSTSVTVGYPMLTLLGIYENERGGWTGTYDPSIPYPKRFEIDYFRAYQPIPTLPYQLTIADGYLRGTTRSDRWVTRWLGGAGNDATLANVWVPEDGEYTLTFAYRCAEPRSFRVLVAGRVVGEFTNVSNGTFSGAFSTVTLRARLQAGANSVSIDNPSGPGPDFGNLTVGH